MTAVQSNGVYIVSKEKPCAEKSAKADAKRLAEAVKRTSDFKKK